jgi:hypothetical protein
MRIRVFGAKAAVAVGASGIALREGALTARLAARKGLYCRQ